MKKYKTNEEVLEHKNAAVSKLDDFLSKKATSEIKNDNKKADLLSYWIEDYVRLLVKEETFNPERIITYRKGDVVKMNLGYRLGSEEGGLHYGVVLDVSNSKKSDTVTVIPLTSFKKGKKIHRDDIFIGKELFQAIIGKHDKLLSELEKEISELKSVNNSTEVHDRLRVLQEKADELETMRKSLIKMKEGSIALVKQVTTISKMRIYDPLYHNQVLYGIRLSPTTICDIDKKFCELFISKSINCEMFQKNDI